MTETGSFSPSGEVHRTETRDLIASDKVEGTAIYNPTKDRLGKVHNFMVDKESGQVEYVVMSFGGVLGIGDSYYPIPWDKLKYDTVLGGYVVNIDSSQLQGAPTLMRDDYETWNDPAYGRRIDDYYGGIM